MKKTGATKQGLTRGDKAHIQFMDKLNIIKESVAHGLDLFPTIQKQSIDASREFYETVSKSQEPERACWYEIIKNSKDPKEREMACNRLRELDNDKNEKTKEHDEQFLQIEGDKARKNIAGSIALVISFAGVSITCLVKNKQIRQLLTTASKRHLL